MIGPKLSIVTPSLNQGQYLETAIQSVLDQQYLNLEYFIVDGGSIDASVEVIRRYEKYVSRWVSEPDNGQSHAINKALGWASGELVAYLNSDDFYEPDAFAQIADAYGRATHVQRSHGTWYAGTAEYVNESGEVVKTWQPHLPPADREKWIAGPWGVPQVATFWHRSLFLKCGFFREDFHYVFDTEFGLRLLFAGHTPMLIPRKLGTRRLHSQSKTVSSIDSFRREALRLPEVFGDRLTSRERRAVLYLQEYDRLRRRGASGGFVPSLFALAGLWCKYPDLSLGESLRSWQERFSRRWNMLPWAGLRRGSPNAGNLSRPER